MKSNKTAEKVMALFNELVNGTGTLIISVPEIARRVEKTERMVRIALNLLEEQDYIERRERKCKPKQNTRITNLANEYIVKKISGGKIYADKTKISGDLLKDFKDLKDLKIKREEEKKSSPDTYLTKNKVNPVAQKKSFNLFQALSSKYAPAVIDYVRNTFEMRFEKGLIGVPSKWIQATLKNEQEKYDRTGKVGFVYTPHKKSYRRKQVSNRPQVEMVSSECDDISADEIAAIRAKAKAYEKEKDRTVAV